MASVACAALAAAAALPLQRSSQRCVRRRTSPSATLPLGLASASSSIYAPSRLRQAQRRRAQAQQPCRNWGSAETPPYATHHALRALLLRLAGVLLRTRKQAHGGAHVTGSVMRRPNVTHAPHSAFACAARVAAAHAAP